MLIFNSMEMEKGGILILLRWGRSLNKEVRREGKGKLSYLEDRELRAKG